MLKTLKTTNIKGTEAATLNIPMKELLRKNTLHLRWRTISAKRQAFLVIQFTKFVLHRRCLLGNYQISEHLLHKDTYECCIWKKI